MVCESHWLRVATWAGNISWNVHHESCSGDARSSHSGYSWDWGDMITCGLPPGICNEQLLLPLLRSVSSGSCHVNRLLMSNSSVFQLSFYMYLAMFSDTLYDQLYTNLCALPHNVLVWAGGVGRWCGPGVWAASGTHGIKFIKYKNQVFFQSWHPWTGSANLILCTVESGLCHPLPDLNRHKILISQPRAEITKSMLS
jgi:hypothetical protein